jgi:Kdo2-lipid IVA lauroyltransferase/acyltransferase
MAILNRRAGLGRFLYELRYRIGEYALRGFIRGLRYIPFGAVELFTSLTAWAAFYLVWRYRHRMEENISAALSQEIPDPAKRKALVWQAWRNFARTVLDTTAVLHWSKEKIIATVALVGEEHLEAALKTGKGVLALSAHLGSFTMIGARLAASGYPFSVVVKHPAHKRFAQLTDDYRSQIGIHTIPAKPRREAVRGILKALRQNRIVLVIADEFKSGDVLVDFFGLKLPAPRGPATLALRTGAVTLPMFAIRQADDSLTLSIGAPIEPVTRDDLDASVLATTALYTRHLEQAIRRDPSQWNWIGLPRRIDKTPSEEAVRGQQAAQTAIAASSDAPVRKTGTLS